MILTLHITVALLSILFSSIAVINPSKRKQTISYLFAGSTLSSGILLVIVEPKTMVQACVSGVIYFSVISIIIALTQKKLAVAKVTLR